MRNRQPTQPGRVKITPENGDSYFAVVEMADEPTEFGTPPTKENLLSDDAEISLFGSPADRTVSEAFLGISAKLKLIMSDMASITLTVTDQAGNPVKNVLVNGIYSDSGAAVYTDDSGVASGYIAEGSQTISIKNYADLNDISKTLTVVKGSTIAESITVMRRNFLKLTTSKSVKFSGNALTADVTSVGGGGGSKFAAGGGGYCTVQYGISVEPNILYSAIVGAGGTQADGGASSFLGVSANGGKCGDSGHLGDLIRGGSGNGKGGDYFQYKQSGSLNGVAGSVAGFSSFTETVLYGGGGSGCSIEEDDGVWHTYEKGNPAGYGGNVRSNGKDGFGGGAGAKGSSSSTSVGIGGSGCVAIRIHFDFGDLAA